MARLPLPRRRLARSGGWFALLLAILPARGQEPAPAPTPGGLTPAQAVARMTLPPGFRVEVEASEPEIRQPVAACYDERGRLWVIEYLQYPVPAGLKPVTVDVYLRTEYDRVPEPPPRGPRGADRIKILEDTDGDGRLDKVTTFVEGLNLASGLAVGHDGLFVAQAPYLLFYPDRNRDDVPDGDPEVLLTGFGLQDAHAVVNSLAWGPDGWLYGAQGSTVTARIQGVEFQQGIWRYHPVAKRFELFAEGGGNTWGLDFDARGRSFGSSNGGFIAFHMVQGGNSWKGFAKHGPLHNPRSYGYFDAIPYDGPKQGGHVTPGGIIYRGGAYPAEFDGVFIGGNLLANTVYWHPLKPRGSTVAGRHGGTLLDAHDPWFRPIDLLTGPDGCIRVVDWYDRRASHLDPRDTWDKSNGRIYRIVHDDGPAPLKPFDLSRLSSDALVDLRTHRNAWWPDTARRILSERRDASVIPKLKTLLASERDEPLALRDLWALNACGGADRETLAGLLDHPVAGVREWAVRLLGDDPVPLTPVLLERLLLLAQHEPDPGVRSQLAASAQRWPAPDALPLVTRLATRDEDATDTFLPLQLWWATERLLRTEPSAVIDALTRPEILAHAIVRGTLLERLARAFASDSAWSQCALLIERAVDPTERAAVLRGLDQGLEGRSLPTVPGPLEPPLTRLWTAGAPPDALVRLTARLGYGPAQTQLIARATVRTDPPEVRLGWIGMLGQTSDLRGKTALRAVAENRDEPLAVRLAALDAMGSHADAGLAGTLLESYPEAPAALQARIVERLLTRPAWIEPLLDAMARGVVPTKALSSTQARQVARLGDEALSAKLARVWGPLGGTTDDARRTRIAEVRGILPEGDKGDPARGAAVFAKACAGCHQLFGKGQAIGPDLTGADRGNLDFLLESLVDPSALIRKEYQPQTIATRDGRVLNGLVLDESDTTLTLFDANQQRIIIARDQIEDQQPSTVSLMPEGLLDPLPDDQIRDLFRYLQSSGPG